jgi:hypothetical protein
MKNVGTCHTALQMVDKGREWVLRIDESVACALRVQIKGGQILPRD